MSKEQVKTRVDGGVLEIIVDRPKANAIDRATSVAMGEIFTDYRDNADLRVAIITGGGEKFFSAGWDLKAAAGGDQAKFSVGETASAETAAAAMEVAGASSVQSVDAILALQSVGDFTEARRKATSRAYNLLDILDELKIALLEGGLPRAKLVALMDVLQTRRDATQDEHLEAALDEVETRAAVELAKFG